MFHPMFHASAWHATVTQIEHEAPIVRGQGAEGRSFHSGSSQEGFDLSDQHLGALLSGLNVGRVAPFDWFIAVQILLV
ncbi:MAG: hypothetical protein J7493_03225 [Porphyrobacter sp.]|nr:hypothetical protein [Porphyrobacter sp.]